MESGTTDAEGLYSFDIAFRATPNKALDWLLRAVPGYGEGEQQGRHILDDVVTAEINSQPTFTR